MPFRILAIDDDTATTRALRKLLEAHGYLVKEVNDSTQALELAATFSRTSSCWIS
jgi:CheY-like chemotaxis protein